VDQTRGMAERPAGTQVGCGGGVGIGRSNKTTFYEAPYPTPESRQAERVLYSTVCRRWLHLPYLTIIWAGGARAALIRARTFACHGGPVHTHGTEPLILASRHDSRRRVGQDRAVHQHASWGRLSQAGADSSPISRRSLKHQCQRHRSLLAHRPTA